jgi:integrase
MEGQIVARPSKNQAPDLGAAHDLSAGLIERLSCPEGKRQVFLRDTQVPGLRVRATPASPKNPDGFKAFVFEAKLNRQTIRRTIGDVRTMGILDARKKALSLSVVVRNDKADPRELEREQKAAKAVAVKAAEARSMTVGEVWPKYLANGRPKRRDAWKVGYRADLEAMAGAGGEKKKRGAGKTRPGPLHPLMSMPLSEINQDTLKTWFDREAKSSKHQAARALMMFRGFLRWCAAQADLRALVDSDAGKGAAIVESLPQMKRRTDCLESAQVAAWFAGTEKLMNRTNAVYLRALLLTGARREEMAALKWADVDFKWKKLTIADKVDATRTLPLTPYLAQQLAVLPRTNAFVFASKAKGGRIADPRASHATVLVDAGIAGLTIHGLRRSFSLLGEAAGAPAGAIAQVMGHKPSATAEGYRPRSIDALRPYLVQIEAHILALAGVTFDVEEEPGTLRAVA